MSQSSSSRSRITKFTDGLLLRDTSLIQGDLWVDRHTGHILNPQSAFYSEHLVPDQIINLEGRIISPGFIDVQLNGAYDFDFSVPADDYASTLARINRDLINTGVTSYLPTITSQRSDVYHSVLPLLASSSHEQRADDGAESLGVHVEGPFLSPAKNGIHNPDILLKARSFQDVESCYGAENLKYIKMMTAAPELGNMNSLISKLTGMDIIFSIGHSDASYEQAQAALSQGATMVTHMFNAMRPFAHRDPGIFGLLGQSESAPPTPQLSKLPSPASSPRSSRSISRSSVYSESTGKPFKPYFGLIADGIHLHPSSIKIAYNAYPAGAILVTDAMKLAGCSDGVYDWTNGDRIIKNGASLKLEANGRIAGSAVTLLECVNNFRRFTGCEVGEALACVTSHPASMLGEGKRKGGLEGGMDADLVILDEDPHGELRIDQVWKFGSQVFGV